MEKLCQREQAARQQFRDVAVYFGEDGQMLPASDEYFGSIVRFAEQFAKAVDTLDARLRPKIIVTRSKSKRSLQAQGGDSAANNNNNNNGAPVASSPATDKENLQLRRVDSPAKPSPKRTRSQVKGLSRQTGAAVEVLCFPSPKRARN